MNESKQAYFERMAPRWDTVLDAEPLRQRIHAELDGFDINPDETILDVGCGTGILTEILLEHLSPKGRIIALDFARAMIEEARMKIPDGRVCWLCADASSTLLETSSIDRCICFSAWPHFPAPGRTADEIFRLLRPGGMLHILHLDGREKINAVHASVGGAIAHDALPAARALGALFAEHGFHLEEATEGDQRYYVSARKPSDGGT